MNDFREIHSLEHALDFFDNYALGRKEELNQKNLGKGQGLIKSYMLEGGIDINLLQGRQSVQDVLGETKWNIFDVGNENFYRLENFGETLGFVEPVSSRHLAIHTIQDTKSIDSLVRNAVMDSSQLDFVWLAGNYLDLLWNYMIQSQHPDRFVTFKFEHKDLFENRNWDSTEEDDTELETKEEELYIPETRASTLSISARASKLSGVIPGLQGILSDFKAIKMLRFPARDMRGGYDFWDWGKITYRSPSFRDGRQYLYSIIQPYQRVTEIIEQRVWFDLNSVVEPNIDDLGFVKGEPVTFLFPVPLDEATFQNFIDITFEKNQGPFKLWGNPIRLSEKRVHIYGIDLYLWKKIYLELTPSRFMLILPKGTCGNTVHRMVSNIQRYLSPDVETFIGGESYIDLVRRVLLDREFIQ